MSECVLGVDPATTSGWSLWQQPNTYLDSGDLAFDAKRGLYWASDKLFALATRVQLDYGVDLQDPATTLTLAIEEPWGRFFRSTRKQAEFLAVWEVVFGHGRVIRVNPATWQSSILGAGPKAGRKRRKEMARRVAATVMKDQRIQPGEDEADAVCIGLWACQEIQRERLMQRRREERPDGRRIKAGVRG